MKLVRKDLLYIRMGLEYRSQITYPFCVETTSGFESIADTFEKRFDVGASDARRCSYLIWVCFIPL